MPGSNKPSLNRLQPKCFTFVEKVNKGQLRQLGHVSQGLASALYLKFVITLFLWFDYFLFAQANFQACPML